MPRIVVTDAATGKVEETLSFGTATQKVKKRVRERDAAAAAPPPAEARAAREDEAPPPRKHKAAPPAAQKAAKKAQNAGAAAAEPPAARQPKQAKKPKDDDRPNFAALPTEEQARCVRAHKPAAAFDADCAATARCGSRTKRSAAAPFWRRRLLRRSMSSPCRPGLACKGG